MAASDLIVVVVVVISSSSSNCSSTSSSAPPPSRPGPRPRPSYFKVDVISSKSTSLVQNRHH